MANLQDIQQKTNDLNAALAALSTSVDTLKAGHATAATTLSNENQVLVDGAASALDQALAAVAAVQTKVNNP